MDQASDTDVSRSPPTARSRPILALVCVGLGVAIWLPLVRFVFSPGAGVREAKARALAARQLRLWTDPTARGAEIARMRRANAEWDFMGRSFLAWALAETALRDPAMRDRALEAIDRIVAETLTLERERGHLHFLMSYATAARFLVEPQESLFVDGEIALMLGLRRLVAERDDYRPLLAARVRAIEHRLKKGPILCGESYPDECWLFCNACALAALRVADKLDGTDHRALFRDWVANAKKRLVDPRTGLLVSSFRLDGAPKDGPEGSSIWFAAHCLRIVDPDFARDQYERARKEFVREALGFAWAREWPVSWTGPMDVDSGPIVPIVEASAGSSGLAFVGASSFGDAELVDRLLTSLDFAGFPLREGDELRYGASNAVGDAVLLYSLVLGPAWEKVGPP